MKTIYKKLLFLFLILPLSSAFSQSSLSGTVIDSAVNQPLPGVNVIVQGASNSTTTDFDGKFQLNGLKNNDVIVVSYIGYQSETINFSGQKTIIVQLKEDSTLLQEVVVQVGYGSVKKKDATGSVTVVTAKDFNKGAIVSADQLLVGKAAGVRITSDGGQPDAAPNIRIRGGASLSAQNSPLIVIDNVPIDNTLAAGQSNPLSLINPNDIESFTILKDASATAIYGSRASNGVIIIVTKKGSLSGEPKFTYSNVFSFSKVTKQIDVLDGNEFESFITENYPSLVSSLGIPDPNSTTGGRILSNTNWQDQVYRASFSQDHNLSVRSAIFNDVPFRASFGYNRTEGLIRTNDYSRKSLGLKISPTYLDGHLKVDVNAKGLSSRKNAIDVGGAIGSAINMDPTKPIYGESPNNRFGGYYQQTSLDAGNGRYLIQGDLNPIARLEQRTNPQSIDKFLGNIEFDYKFHSLPELRAVVNLGMEASQSTIEELFEEGAIQTYQFNASINPNDNYLFNPGLNYKESQTVMNKTIDSYLAYSKSFSGFVSKFEAQAGHSFQSFLIDGNKNEYQYNQVTGIREPKPNVQNPNNRYYNNMTLESYFGRMNLDLMQKYLFTFTLRADATSLFKKDQRWGYFPAGAFAWKIKEESFLKNSASVNDLKLRLGYGLTGNSDIRNVSGYYPYSPLFSPGNQSGQYLPGVNIYTANPFNPNLTWETTSTYNVGLDFDLFKNSLITGSIDAYYRETKDLLALVSFPTGQFLTNAFVNNAAELSNKGIEANVTVGVVKTDDIDWTISGNVAYNIGNVEKINGADRIQAGGFVPGTGNPLTFHSEGEQPGSAWVFEQVYDQAGKPIPNVVVDRDNNGLINDSDRYFVKVTPNWNFGFSTSFNYKKLDFNANFRGQLGGNVYNSVEFVGGWSDRVLPVQNLSLSNVLSGELNFVTNNTDQVKFSDYFIEDATFLRCESVTLGYKFDKIYKSTMLRVFVGANNLFILTKYSGQDPENFNGVDNNFYPRPRTFNMGVTIDF